MLEIFLVSCLIGVIFSSLGCFVLWKRYSSFGDGISHASLLAGTISSLVDVPIFFSAFALSIFFAWFLSRKSFTLPENNASIGMASNVLLSLALILLAVKSEGSAKINLLLFGDILAANLQDIIVLVAILFCEIVFLKLFYSKLILSVLSRDIAFARKIDNRILDFLFIFILSYTIFICIKIVGALLVTGILLIPPLIAQNLASSPYRMLVFAMFFSILMNSAGICLSWFGDLPFAPSVIVSGGGLYFIISFIFNRKRLKEQL